MLGVSKLRAMLGKTSNARVEEERSDLGDREQGLPAAPSLWMVGFEPGVLRYRASQSDDAGLRSGLRELAAERRRFGYRRLYLVVKRDGVDVNWKKLYRLYREEQLTLRKRGGRKRTLGTKDPMAIPQDSN